MEEEQQWIDEVLSGNKQAYAHIINKYKNQLSHELEEVPDELTLHLISVTRYEEVKDKWKVPLD